MTITAHSIYHIERWNACDYTHPTFYQYQSNILRNWGKPTLVDLGHQSENGFQTGWNTNLNLRNARPVRSSLHHCYYHVNNNKSIRYLLSEICAKIIEETEFIDKYCTPRLKRTVFKQRLQFLRASSDYTINK